VDRLAALAREERGRLKPERSEDRCVEPERTLEVRAHKINVAEPDEHPAP
jgi:hypothetical protein